MTIQTSLSSPDISGKHKVLTPTTKKKSEKLNKKELINEEELTNVSMLSPLLKAKSTSHIAITEGAKLRAKSTSSSGSAKIRVKSASNLNLNGRASDETKRRLSQRSGLSNFRNNPESPPSEKSSETMNFSSFSEIFSPNEQVQKADVSNSLYAGNSQSDSDTQAIIKYGGHSLTKTTFLRPTNCDACESLLMGVRKQGFQCSECSYNYHEKCLNISGKCGTAKYQCQPNNHIFKMHSYRQPTNCAVCTKMLKGLSSQGLQCSTCKLNVHKDCGAKLILSVDEEDEKEANKAMDESAMNNANRFKTIKKKLVARDSFRASIHKNEDTNGNSPVVAVSTPHFAKVQVKVDGKLDASDKNSASKIGQFENPKNEDNLKSAGNPMLAENAFELEEKDVKGLISSIHFLSADLRLGYEGNRKKGDKNYRHSDNRYDIDGRNEGYCSKIYNSCCGCFSFGGNDDDDEESFVPHHASNLHSSKTKTTNNMGRRSYLI